SLNQRPNEPRRPGNDPANIDKVVCEAGDQPQGVIITETVRDKGRLLKTQRIEADEVAIYKEEGRMDAANQRNGRGNVRIVQLGPKGEPAGPAQPGARRP